jgi:hypothetical protein
MTGPEMHFRRALLLLASVAVTLSLWILATQCSVAGIYKLPTSATAAAAAKLHRNGANLAAALGVVRGDLWAQSAFTYADLCWANSTIKTANNSNSEDLSAGAAREAIEKALRYAPHLTDVWLMLAAVGSRFNWRDLDTAAALKMAYYTGPSETSLIPMRLLVAARSATLNDSDVQQFVRRDIRLILLRLSTLKPAIQAAYHEANSTNKRIIESAVNDVDPAFAELLRAGPGM